MGLSLNTGRSFYGYGEDMQQGLLSLADAGFLDSDNLLFSQYFPKNCFKMKEMGSIRGATSVVPLQDLTIVVTKLFNIAVNDFVA